MERISKIRLLDEPRETEGQSTVGSSNGTRKLPPSGSGSGSGGVDTSGSGTYSFNGGTVTEGKDAEHDTFTWYITCLVEWSATSSTDGTFVTFHKFDVTIKATSTYEVALSNGKKETRTSTEIYQYGSTVPFQNQGNSAVKICDNVGLILRYVIYNKETDSYINVEKTIEKRASVTMSVRYDATTSGSENKLVAEDGYINI